MLQIYSEFRLFNLGQKIDTWLQVATVKEFWLVNNALVVAAVLSGTQGQVCWSSLGLVVRPWWL